MGMVVPFFPRQTVVGCASPVNYYSEPFDASQYDSINVEFRVFGLIGTGPTITASLQTAAELHASTWATAVSFAAVVAAPTVLTQNLSNTTMSQFIRAKVNVNASDHALTFSMIGVARESGS